VKIPVAHLILSVPIFFLFTGTITAQDNAFTQSVYNYFYLNPAYLGVEGSHTIKQHTRSQWSALNPPILTTSLSYDHYFDSLNSGIGIIAGVDRLTAGFEEYQVDLAYSYRITFDEAHHLSFGVSGGLVHYSWDLIFSSSDPGVFFDTVLLRETTTDMGAGIYYRYKYFFGGFSVNHLYNKIIDIRPGLGLRKSQLYSILVGYKFKMADATYLIPSIRYFHQDFDLLDVNIILELMNAFIAGVAYHENRASIILGFRLFDQFRFSYSYDYFFNIPSFGATHEFGLSFTQNRKNPIY